MRAQLVANPELALRTLDQLDVALFVCERAASRVLLTNERGSRLLREFGGSFEQLPSMLTQLMAGHDAEIDAAGTRFSSISLDDDELALVIGMPGASMPLGLPSLGLTVGTVKRVLDRLFQAARVL